MAEIKFHCALIWCFSFCVAILFTVLPILQAAHPYSSWYPFVVPDGPNMRTYGTLIYECVCVQTAEIQNISSDVFIYSLMGFVYYQIRLLGTRLEQIGWDIRPGPGLGHFKRIVECIELHQEINK